MTTALLCMLLSAQAATLPLWTVSDFGESGDVAGTNGWTNGYSGDPWLAYRSRAYSQTDVNTGDTGFTAYGQNGAADNWLARGESFDDGVVRVTYTNYDDDSFGLVSHLDDGTNFYLLLVTASNAPPPVGSVERTTAILIRVENGVGEVMDEVSTSQSGQGDDALSLRTNDGVLEARLNGETLFEVTDPAPLPPGRAGIYAYDTGGVDRDDTYAFASEVVVELTDDDDDQVADDVDNCETAPNTEQADRDNNGIGDACDEQPTDDTAVPPDDTAQPPDDSAPQTDDTANPNGNDSDGGGPNNRPNKGGVTLQGPCACASGSPEGGLAGLALVLAAALRRRR